MNVTTKQSGPEACAALNLTEPDYEELVGRVSDLFYDDARRVVEKMLGLTEQAIIADRTRELVQLSAKFGIRLE